jgi:hypothetical protein
MLSAAVDNQGLSYSVYPLAVAVASTLRRTVRSVAPATGLALILTAPGFANSATYRDKY